jgi:hypothetical protein
MNDGYLMVGTNPLHELHHMPTIDPKQTEVSKVISERIRAVPLFYKVLIANVAIVLFGAIAGTYVTATTFQDVNVPSRFELVLVYVSIGVLLSVTVNFLVLRAAFQPLDSLERDCAQVFSV